MSETEFNPADKRDFPSISIHEEWSVPSELTGENEYRDKFRNLLENMEGSWIDPDDIDNLVLGFDEALINAIKYGNKEDSSKNIEVVVDINEDKLVVSIQDTSNPEPFDPDQAFNSVEDESKLLETHGRGLTFMKAFYPDGVEYQFTNPGNKVTMTKKRS